MCRERKRRPLQTQFDPIPIHAATPHPVFPPRIRSISACLRPFHAFYCSSASKSFSYGRTNQRVLEASFPYFNRRKKKGLRWPARPGLSSLSPDSFYRRLKTPRFAIQRKVVRSEDQNNAHDKHRPGKLEYFVKDAITRCCGWLSAYSSDYGPSTFQKKRCRLRILYAVRNGDVSLGFSP